MGLFTTEIELSGLYIYPSLGRASNKDIPAKFTLRGGD